jgi:hypothetical protein
MRPFSTSPRDIQKMAWAVNIAASWHLLNVGRGAENMVRLARGRAQKKNLAGS